MKYKLAIFDLDGTVLDTAKDISSAVNYVLKKYGFPQVDMDHVLHNTGYASRYLLEHSVPEGTDVDALYPEYTAYYNAHSNDTSSPYPGITGVLEKLKACGLRLALVSNKPEPAVITLMDQHFPGIFECTIGDKDGQRKKPYPDSVNRALALLGEERENCVYIGDSEVDVLTAKNAGMPCISVKWGFRSEKELIDAGASLIVSSPEELYDAITGD